MNRRDIVEDTDLDLQTLWEEVKLQFLENGISSFFHNACKDLRGHGGGRKKTVEHDYLAVVWECYTCKYWSTPRSAAVLSISLHLFLLLLTQTPPSHWLALSTLSIAGSWSEAKSEHLCVIREGQYISTPSVFISKPHWRCTAVRKGYIH